MGILRSGNECRRLGPCRKELLHSSLTLPVCEFFKSLAVGWNKRCAVPAIRMVIDMSFAGTALRLFQPTKTSQPLCEVSPRRAYATESRATENGKLFSTRSLVGLPGNTIGVLAETVDVYSKLTSASFSGN